jgi:hypothetical protein
VAPQSGQQDWLPIALAEQGSYDGMKYWHLQSLPTSVAKKSIDLKIEFTGLQQPPTDMDKLPSW